ncbi:MAG: VOC family protein [Heyndrickxia sp.]
MTVRKEWSPSLPTTQFRIARPTNHMDKIIEFYGQGLGLEKVGEFHMHEGYEGVMFGLPEKQYHLEFTQHESGNPIPHPPEDQLLVFYIADTFRWNEIVNRLMGMGYRQVPSENPYWDRGGITIEDPDGYRVVLMNTVGI